MWDRHALCLEAIEMQRNCALHLSLDFEGYAQLALGAGGRWFESSRPDHFSDL
ncbi:MAG: hypothetical protein PVSMB1_12010 [Gemmatimonadaceae bacterium]